MSGAFRSALVSAFVAALLLVLPSRASADGPGNVEELKKRGNQAMMELNYAEALEAYRAAIALAPDDAVLFYNLGRAHQAREEYPAALDALSVFVTKAPPELRARVPKLDALLDDIRSRVATVKLACTQDAEKATVTIGSKTTVAGCTRTPKELRVSVPERKAEVEVRLVDAQLQAEATRVQIAGGAPPITITLTTLPKASSGRLLVKASPTDARVSVDGLLRGNPPVEVPLAPGPHVVDVAADRHDDRRIPVVIDVGTTREIEVPLSRSAPITTKWWFWTGVTVAAVGTGVLIWLLVAQPERDATPGTIDPGVLPVMYRF